jgi:hypothetical protein
MQGLLYGSSLREHIYQNIPACISETLQERKHLVKI